jgi:hypothetical protein
MSNPYKNPRKKTMPEGEIQGQKAAHKHSFRNEEAVRASVNAGCFHCCEVFAANTIKRWVTENEWGRTAVCPHCGIDSVIAESSGLPVTREFLQWMEEYWFTEAE